MLQDANNFYLGNEIVSRLYMGETLVWPSPSGNLWQFIDNPSCKALSNFRVVYTNGNVFADWGDGSTSGIVSNVNYNHTFECPTFSPNNISDLVLWLDGNDNSTMDTSTNYIESITDKSSSNYIFTRQGTTNNNLKPIFITTGINNKPSIHIKQDGYLGNSDFVLNLNNPYTVFYVFKDNKYDLGGKNNHFGIKSILNNTQRELVWNYNISDNYSLAIGPRGASYGVRIGPPGYTLNNPSLVQWSYDATSTSGKNGHSIKINNIERIDEAVGNFHGGSSSVGNQTAIGYFSDGNSNDYYFGEFIIYNRLLTISENQQVLNYLAEKWGLNI
jgi:hypothetical protein